MESLVFHLNYSENTEIDVWKEVHASIKNRFTQGSIKVLIEKEPEAVPKRSLEQMLEDNAREGFEYAVPADDFLAMAEQLFNDESFDIAGKIATYKREVNQHEVKR